MIQSTAMQQLIDFIDNQEYNFLNKEQLEYFLIDKSKLQ